MVQPGIVEALADLVGLEFEDRQIDRSVAQVVAIGERAVGLADFLEVESPLIELGHFIRVFCRDRDVAQFRHLWFPLISRCPRL